MLLLNVAFSQSIINNKLRTTYYIEDYNWKLNLVPGLCFYYQLDIRVTLSFRMINPFHWNCNCNTMFYSVSQNKLALEYLPLKSTSGVRNMI